MIIKSHIRGGYRSAASYLKSQGENEKIRLVKISDPDAKDLDEAFHNMWVIASNSRAKKPLHHISINPFKDEKLTDKQVKKIIKRCEEKYGYEHGDHQYVIVEHIKDGRQHFHVIWNRVTLSTNKAKWPGHHWKKSKQAAREMEKELGLKCPTPKRVKRAIKAAAIHSGQMRSAGRYKELVAAANKRPINAKTNTAAAKERLAQPIKPLSNVNTKGWPLKAVIDWENWGQKNPPRFFTQWPELMPDGFVLSGGPSR